MKTNTNELMNTFEINNESIDIRPIEIDDINFMNTQEKTESVENNLQEIFDIDYENTMAFIAVKSNTFHKIGMSRYELDDENAVHCSLTIDSEWENTNLGKLLIRELADYAHANNKKVIYSHDTIVDSYIQEIAQELGLKKIIGSHDFSVARYELPESQDSFKA